ncbi:hypothetical protein [Actinomadura alba]|uniref:Uncharacterized protein n=1 Tax=Actinomadura alba TaxID=406431 RepID=A0ABR7LS76_9ACTN|nr:hypothetical protein [Actinomadura alba]MBC6467335.1 hypothetical protein [Actinomadura alba]
MIDVGDADAIAATALATLTPSPGESGLGRPTSHCGRAARERNLNE